MDSYQIKDILLMYEAVYNDSLREQVDEYNNSFRDEDIVEVATEYFYNYGLNDDGINILIEKIGLDNFMEFVYDLSEDFLIINEARKVSKAKKQEGSFRSRQQAKLEAQRAAKSSAEKRKETETKEPESRGSDTEAKSEQPKSKKPVRNAIAKQILAGMERHKKAVNSPEWQKTRETGSKLLKGIGTALKSAVSEENDLFDYLLEYLVSEGYADTNQDALVLMANMNKEELDEATRLFYKLQKKGKGGSSTARAQLKTDADLESQKNLKRKLQRQKQMREREPDDNDPRDHGSMSAAERNPSMR